MRFALIDAEKAEFSVRTMCRVPDVSESGFFSWKGRYKKLIGITDPKITFHSFRHTFIDQLKQLDVPDGKIQELVGHANHSITTGRGLIALDQFKAAPRG